jgi:superfamily II DNA or RNA helicase
VARSLAESLAPAEAADPAPEWLRPGQARLFRQALSAIRRFNGALLAAPVGAGKTFIALAVARHWNGEAPTTCLVPATLCRQWYATARELGIAIEAHSFERLSRGRPPCQGSELVLIDESHHLRNPATRRYHNLAPWLIGRRALLLSATPVVNRLVDVAHQLLLAVRDDALQLEGVRSILKGLATKAAEPGIGHLILAGTGQPVADGPRRTDRRIELENDLPASLVAGLDALQLSTDRAVAALLRGTLWHAAASSPAALHGNLARYGNLLKHAQEAKASGRPIMRSELRAIIGPGPEQLVMWELFSPGEGEAGDLALSDLPLVDGLTHASAALAAKRCTKARRLAELLEDGRRAIVFVSARETVRYLRGQLRGPVAWCTGERAGIGPSTLERDAVLEWFRAPGAQTRPGLKGPRILITTDVTAEGLSLQGAERVVHYDLPWTAVRLEQRDGRILRPGSPHATAEIVRFDPSPLVEDRLSRARLLADKALLPERAGLGTSGAWQWRWREEVRLAIGPGRTVPGIARVKGSASGVLIGVQFSSVTGTTGPRPIVGWVPETGLWSQDGAVVAARLEEAARSAGVEAATLEEIDQALRSTWPFIRNRLRAITSTQWEEPGSTLGKRSLLRRLNRLAQHAARRRDVPLLATVERAIRFVGAGHTAGETMRLAEIASMETPAILQAVLALPKPLQPDGPWLPRVGGVVIFQRE